MQSSKHLSPADLHTEEPRNPRAASEQNKAPSLLQPPPSQCGLCDVADSGSHAVCHDLYRAGVEPITFVVS